MSKVSMVFGELISDFLKRNALTFRGAALKSSVSAAYWKDMSDGRVPSEDVVTRIAGSFEDLDENELRTAAGYALRTDDLDAVKAVDFALRSNKDLPEEGKRQILNFVRKIEKRYPKQ